MSDNGVEKITSRIIDEAEAQAAEIRKASDEQKQAALAEAGERAEKIVADAKEKGGADKVRVVARRQVVADIDGRNAVLKRKQELINRAFDEALEKITSLDRSEYLDFLVNTAKAAASDGGEVILNKKDAGELGRTLVDTLNREISGGKFTLSEETRDIRAGLFIRSGKVYYDGSVESMLRDSRSSLAAEAAGILFR
ncbi:MAG: V-type ATP synthase subunit E [Eubacteriales bacterium]|nr:V-type ATP synthase subunit E [Eubacteriales bacterium]